MKPSSKLIWGFLTVLVILSVVYFLLRYTSAIEFFTSSQCTFKTLGTYKLTTTPITSSSPNGLIYISGITATPVTSDWNNITSSDSLSYSYTTFTPKDIAGTDVKALINNIMACKNIPDFGNSLGVNNNPALILCLQSYNDAVGTNAAVLSRVFFVKCFVPKTSASDSNKIVGEIANNPSNKVYYIGGPRPVGVIQGAVGVPNLNDTYTLSYTICPAGNRPEGFSYSDCCNNYMGPPATPVISVLLETSDYTSNCVSTTNKSIGDACVTGTECSSGTCTNSKCVASSSSGGSSQGQSCSTQSDCATGLSCSNNVCRVQQTYYCSRYPDGYDPHYGIPCSQEIGTYSASSDSGSGSGGSDPWWKNYDWGTTDDDDDIYDADEWYKSRGRDSDRDSDSPRSDRASRMWREWLENSRGDGSPEDKDSEPSSRSSRSENRWSGYGNRWRGSTKDMSDQLENVRPQRYSNSIVDTKTMQPSLATCNNFYNCKKPSNSNTDDDESCE